MTNYTFLKDLCVCSVSGSRGRKEGCKEDILKEAIEIAQVREGGWWQ